MSAGIPAIGEVDRQDPDVIWPWAGLYRLDPVSALADHLNVLEVARRYFQAAGARKFSFRVRLRLQRDELHLLWTFKKNSGSDAALVKIHALLRDPEGAHSLDFIPAWDGIKITYGMPRHSMGEWKVSSRVGEVLELIAFDPARLLRHIVDVTR